MKTFRFRHFSISLNWVLVLAFVISAVVGADAILTTIDNVRNAAPWWHTAFTAVESVVFLTTTVCCILRALQPGCSGRFRFYYAVMLLACLIILMRLAFFQYERLFLNDPHWLDWIISPLSLAGWCLILYVVWRLRHADKDEQQE